MKILTVDDDELSLAMLEHTLLRAGYEVQTAPNGKAALDILRDGGVRLVISDWEMPEMTGVELCEEIRRGDFESYVYVILLTSHASSEDIVTGMSAGADDFVAKPFNPGELLVRIRAGMRVLALETREVAIFALAKLAESRDPETGRHLERVQCYSRALAQQLLHMPSLADEVDAEYIRLIYLTSPLHDIGKVAIPDHVLRKPGKLTAEEFAIMQTHTTYGSSTLEAALARFPDARFLKIARDIAAAHHERWDGSGYPLGLAGEAIPLAARIVALADVYDALTSKRCYKDAFPHERAAALIAGESGKHFDPRIVRAFQAVESEFLDIQRRFGSDSDPDRPSQLLSPLPSAAVPVAPVAYPSSVI